MPPLGTTLGPCPIQKCNTQPSTSRHLTLCTSVLLSEFVGVCWNSSGFVGICRELLGFVGIRRELLGFVGIHRNLLGFVGILQDLLLERPGGGVLRGAHRATANMARTSFSPSPMNLDVRLLALMLKNVLWHWLATARASSVPPSAPLGGWPTPGNAVGSTSQSSPPTHTFDLLEQKSHCNNSINDSKRWTCCAQIKKKYNK